MKQSPLLKVLLIYHEKDHVHMREHSLGLERAFEYVRPDRSLSDLEELPDVWERVAFRTISNQEAWRAEEEIDDGTVPTLFVVLVTEKLVADADMRLVLDTIASVLPARTEDGNCDLICFSLSELALGQLPPVFSRRQVPPLANLAERRLISHKLGLMALHRARLLLGDPQAKDRLKMFISHAKVDGVFLAQSLMQAIKSIPELTTWYDAQDLASGSDFPTELEAAASNCVLIAVRTNNYEQRKVCREEFMTALMHGVPIVVVDALMQPVSEGSPLPFSAVPNVRIPDGNTFRVLLATLREHLKLLLMQASASEKVQLGINLRVWLRLPSQAAVKRALRQQQLAKFWLVPRALCYDSEFLELRDWLSSLGAGVEIDHLETFRPLSRP